MTGYPLACSSWNHEELEALHAVIDSNHLTMGPRVAEFERAFAQQFGARHAVMVNSGSSANLLAVAALFYTREPRLRRGDEVIVPAVSWATTYTPLQQYGLKLKFVDVDLDTLNFDLDALREAVSDRTRMIFAVNLLGNPNDFNAIGEIIGSREIVLIEDNCESMGASLGGRHTGTFGAMGTWSTFFSHHMSTMEGGLVTTDDEELYHVLLCLRSHGWTRHLPTENLVTGTKSEDDFDELFRFVLPGYNLRPLELSGAVGMTQLRKLDGFVELRRQNAEVFLEAFSGISELRLQREIGTSSWFGFSMIIEDGTPGKRRELVRYLAESGIECRPIVAGNFARSPVAKHCDHVIHGELTNADIVDERGFFIGNHPFDAREGLALVAREVRAFFAR